LARLPAALIAACMVAFPASADDPVARLAEAICRADNATGVETVMLRFEAEEAVAPRDIAEALGTASARAEAGHCASADAAAQAWSRYRGASSPQDGLAAAFALGRIAARPLAQRGASGREVGFTDLGWAGETLDMQ
jgi:hypothetical protein